MIADLEDVQAASCHSGCVRAWNYSAHAPFRPEVALSARHDDRDLEIPRVVGHVVVVDAEKQRSVRRHAKRRQVADAERLAVADSSDERAGAAPAASATPGSACWRHCPLAAARSLRVRRKLDLARRRQLKIPALADVDARRGPLLVGWDHDRAARARRARRCQPGPGSCRGGRRATTPCRPARSRST